MSDIQLNRCPHWDCGWCYAPSEVENNSKGGSCWAANNCPVQQKLIEEKQAG
ncbi:hypothetical protein [Rheinheimera sp. MMS21-TC3]|uniref:hypothetical protein n=1 Tax=Rheinheimera sp. MMS21-TC3 TaxID=3072790 RepID=UPI0028C417E1|nr:hypothetical protein [Rheinheimera sp. MMS21-TC3]WNO60852.1 hypothetical protein RDV63_07785 [Rheinheimera sp. MMS21-TC3]